MCVCDLTCVSLMCMWGMRKGVRNDTLIHIECRERREGGEMCRLLLIEKGERERERES